jgi:hypothetical protein
VRFLLRLERLCLERHLDGPYDAAASRKLDGVIAALEALQ